MSLALPLPVEGLQLRELQPVEAPLLQAFFDANPEYFQAINGRPAGPDDAAQEFEDLPPPHLGFSQRWMLGLVDAQGGLQGVAVVLSDFIATGVWHVGLYILASALHGRGQGAAVYRALEEAMRAAGAQWIRLGVVQGNAKGERFWQAQGYTEVRQRHEVDTGARLNTIRVLVKALGEGRLADYLQRVPRDQPGSTLS